MEDTEDSTFELTRLKFRWFAVSCGASSSALEATRSHFTRFEAASERSRGHSSPPGSSLEPARRRRKASSSLPEPSGELPERSPGSRILEKNSIKLRSEPLGPREPLEPRDNCSQSLWSLGMAAPRASRSSRWLLPTLWSLEIAAASRKLSRRRSKALRSSSETPSSKALPD